MPVGKIGEDGHVNYYDLCSELISDRARNQMIAKDVLDVVSEGCSPVVLSDRKEQLDSLLEILSGKEMHVLRLTGGMGQKAMREMGERLARIPLSESRVILATGSYLGEGFDDSRLDTLFLAMPISWKGRLTQYAGRLHRLHDGKREVHIYDYVDLNVGICAKMYERRMKGYEAIGYKVVVPIGATEGWPASVSLPVVPRWKETVSESLHRLCRDGVDEALADLFVQATLQLQVGERLLGQHESKASALRFLVSRLNSIDATRGQFQHCVRLPIPCGANPYLEVDLFSKAKRLVIRLDERKDIDHDEIYWLNRREDYLLQRNGYIGIRFLVEDVCERLGDVLDAILNVLD